MKAQTFLATVKKGDWVLFKRPITNEVAKGYIREIDSHRFTDAKGNKLHMIRLGSSEKWYSIDVIIRKIETPVAAKQVFYFNTCRVITLHN